MSMLFQLWGAVKQSPHIALQTGDSAPIEGLIARESSRIRLV